MHRFHEDKVHEMINIYPKNLYIRPHKHSDKTETKHIVEGAMWMLMFDEMGKITNRFVMGKEYGNTMIYRIESNLYHSIVPITEIVVFHEIINGPYTGSNDSIFPDWAPENNDAKGIEEFIRRYKKG
jgi:cupin fold WbuC family metalloprotein